MTFGRLLLNAVCWIVTMFCLWFLSKLLGFDPVWVLIGWYLWDDMKKENSYRA